MIWFVCVATFVCLSVPVSVAAAEFKLNGQTFTIPDGFTVELVAGPPLIERPVSMDFDEEGRLYVTLSSGSNDNVHKQLAEQPHSVVRLEDRDGDGRFDRKTLFADKLMLPQGAMWFDGSLYVSAPPSIWKLTDCDNDGVSDKREEWFNGKTLTGCANDLHGPYLGPDGWIYWCKGAFAEQNYQVNGAPFVTRASHIFRARPDGSRLEPVMTGGMDNPVGLEFTPTGERLLVGTFFQLPEAGKRDGILHAVYGGLFGKANEVIDDHKKTGDLLPIMTHLGSAAPCSIVQLRSSTWDEEFKENLFVANFNLHSVTRHILQPTGATFQTADKPFLTSDSTDFHPTCILEDADGSLLIIDTGGWYKLCCPTSQLWKPDLTGAIYRVRYNRALPPSDPRGLKVDWQNAKPQQLTSFLDDERPRVVALAIQRLADLHTNAIPALLETLRQSKSEDARRNAVWALTRIDHPSAREATYAAFPGGANSSIWTGESVVQVALYSIGLWRDRNVLSSGSGESLAAIVGRSDAVWEPNLAIARAAIEALGRIGDSGYAHAHLAQAVDRKKPTDRFLEHAVIYALLELQHAEGTRKLLNDTNLQRAALIALDQMRDSKLTSNHVVPLLGSEDMGVRQAALWVIGRHPEWGPALSDFFKSNLSNLEVSKDGESLLRQLVTFSKDPSLQSLLASVLADTNSTPATRALVVKVISRSSLSQAPDSWTEQIVKILKSEDSRLIPIAVDAARSLHPSTSAGDSLASALLAIAESSTYPDEVRLTATMALSGLQPLTPSLFEFTRHQIHPENPINTKNLAVGILNKASLSEEQLNQLVDDAEKAGPLELTRLLPVFEKGPSTLLGEKLLRVLPKAKAFSSLRAEQLRTFFAKFPSAIQTAAEPLIASRSGDLQKQGEHLNAVLSSLKNGDVRRGQAVFNSPKAACSACHAIGYGGGRLGPDLTKIGQIRNERDLLEAILYPSASFVRSYEPFVVVTVEGDDLAGIIRGDGREEITLATGPGTEMKIARKNIKEIRPGTTSVMPAGLDEQLTPQELSDLIVFLKAAK